MEKPDFNQKSTNWTALYRMGGAAPFIAIVFYLSQIILIFAGVSYPETAEGWFELFLDNKFFGLFVINALDIFSIAFLGVMFLALYAALRETNGSLMTAGVFFALLGVAIFVSARADIAAACIELSDQLAAAVSEARRVEILTAGTAIMSLTRATPETFGFLFMAFGGFFISLVILQSRKFKKWIGFVGIVGLIATLANDISLVGAPAAASAIMPVNGLLWFTWWIAVGVTLLRLGNTAMRS